MLSSIKATSLLPPFIWFHFVLSYISAVVFFTGGIGDWKNHLTIAENEMFDSILQEWTAGKEIPFTYE